jgi:hypothetical protein
MRQVSFAEMVRCALRDQNNAVLTEPLPTRWIDLINSLDQQERQTRQSKAERDHK